MTQPAIDSNPPQSHFQGAPTLVEAQSDGVAPDRIAVSAEPHKLHHQKDGLLPAIQSLLSIIVLAIFIITFCVQPFRIPSGSMEPALLIGDFLLVNKQDSAPGPSSWLLPAQHIHRGEIVVFHYPINPGMHLVKRVIGVPGDRIKLRNGHVYINDRPLSEPYATYIPSPPDNYRDNFPSLQSADPDVDSRWWIRMHKLIENGDLIVPSGSYFVLGDNRNDSEDSRYWGFVPREAIVGEPLLIYFSLQQHGSGDDIALSQSSSVAASRHRSTAIDALASFARWDRTLQVVK